MVAPFVAHNFSSLAPGALISVKSAPESKLMGHQPQAEAFATETLAKAGMAICMVMITGGDHREVLTAANR